MFTNLQTDSAIYMHTWRHLSGETRTLGSQRLKNIFFFLWSEISMKNMIMQLHAGNITCQWCVQVLVGAYSTEDEQFEEVLFFCLVFNCPQIP